MSAVKETRRGRGREEPRMNTRARAKNTNIKESTSSPVSWTASIHKTRRKRTLSTASPGDKSARSSVSKRVAKLRNVSAEKNVLKRVSSPNNTREKKLRKMLFSEKDGDPASPVQEQKKGTKMTKSLSTSSDVLNSSDKSTMPNDLVCVVKVQHCNVTPKSSHTPLNLTPHKSVKSPKRSPKSLTLHSKNPIKLSKTPRNLSHSLDSLRKYATPPMRNEQESRRVGKRQSMRLSFDTKYVLRRFSKSPKIVLRSPKPKAKSKSPKLNVLAKSFILKDIGKKEDEGAKSKKDRGGQSKKIGKENKDLEKSIHEGIRRQNSSGITPRKSRPLAPLQHYEDILSKTPIVLLQRLSLAKKSSSKLDKSNLSRIAAKTSQDISLGNEKTQRLSHKRVLPVQGSEKPGPLMSSTPRDGKKQYSQDINLNERKNSLNNSRSNRSTLSTNNIVKSPAVQQLNGSITMIENESEPSFSNVNSMDTSKLHKSPEGSETPSRRNSSRLRKEPLLTPGNEQKSLERNATYEILEPKTPNLREKCRVRSFMDRSHGEVNSKKDTKVRFTSSQLKSPDRFEKDAKQSSKEPIVNVTSLASRVKNSKLNVTPLKISKSNERLIKSHQNQSLTSRVTPVAKKTSPTLSQKKPVSGMKYSTTKKTPNFTQIHKRLFSKSESVVDAKRRLEERHRALRSTRYKSLTGGGISADKPGSKIYNRYGFRLKKDEATDYILGKRQLQTREKQKQENREILKGVRMNRRFELQMKARKMVSV